MIFWDTSALVPLLVDEPGSAAASALLREGAPMAVWWATPLEIGSALFRRERDGALSHAAVDQCLARLDLLASAWAEVLPTELTREHALNLLRRHPLRAADAAQLGAAITLARARPRGHRFATLDARLARAARGEGFELAFPLP